MGERIIEVGKTHVGNLAVIVGPSSSEKVFQGIDPHKPMGRRGKPKMILSPWARLTGRAIEAAASAGSIEESQIDEWLSPIQRKPGQLAISRDIVVAFPDPVAEPNPALLGWKLILGPTLSEVAAPEPAENKDPSYQ